LREGAEEQRGKNLVFELSSAPLLPCSPAQEYKVLRDMVRNPGKMSRGFETPILRG
jgi:hypothetical protein